MKIIHLSNFLFILYMSSLVLDLFLVIPFILFFLLIIFKLNGLFLDIRILLVQLFLIIGATYLFLNGIIPEAKFSIIYLMQLIFGLIFISAFRSCLTLKNYAFIGLYTTLGYTLNISSHLSMLEFISNYAEVVLFGLFLYIYMSNGKNFPYKLNIFLSFLSDSKFMLLNSIVRYLPSSIYSLVLILIVLLLFFINPFGSLDSRISLLEIFYNNMDMNRFFLLKFGSVNDLVIVESTIYSFHNILLDNLWNFGYLGVLFLLLFFSTLYTIYKNETLRHRRDIIALYIICITFGFSLFFGTKFMTLMFGTMISISLPRISFKNSN